MNQVDVKVYVETSTVMVTVDAKLDGLLSDGDLTDSEITNLEHLVEYNLKKAVHVFKINRIMSQQEKQ